MKNQIDFNSYTLWIKNLISRYSKHCISIYQLGNITYPGLSDVDVIIIPKKNKFNYILFDLSKTSMNEMPFLLHNPFILPEENIGLMKFVDFDNIKLIYGVDLLDKVKYDKKFNILLFLESYFSMKDYYYGRNGEKLSISDVPIMRSLRFTIKLASEVLNIKLYDSFVSKMDFLRENYFNKPGQLNEINILFENNIMFLINEMNKQPFGRSHINNLPYYSRYNLNTDDLFEALRFRNLYTKNLINSGFDYGSLLRSSFYPLKKLKFSQRLFRKLYHKLEWKK